MKKGAGKAKGSDYERAVCKELTFWVSGQSKPLLFWRSITSGGHFTQTRKASLHAGDITVISSPEDKGHEDALLFIKKFTIECKAYKKLIFMLGHTSELQAFWKQAINEKIEGKEALLFLKINNRKQLIGCESSFASFLQQYIEEYQILKFINLPTLHLFKKDNVFSLSFETIKSYLI